jgi:hypothetical protein
MSHRERIRFDPERAGSRGRINTGLLPPSSYWLGRWAMNLMLINESTRKLRLAVRHPERRSAGNDRRRHLEVGGFSPLCCAALDLLVIQIDGLHIGNDLVLVAAFGIDAEGHKHPLGLVDGATENTSVVRNVLSLQPSDQVRDGPIGVCAR